MGGMEVIFIRYLVVDEVVKIALEEDADVIALAFYGSGMMYDAPRVMDLLREKDAEDKMVIIGGTISPEEETELLAKGIAKCFPSGRGTARDIVECVNDGINKN